jgi:predicted ATPase
MESKIDYRVSGVLSQGVYFHPLGDPAHAALAAAFATLARGHSPEGREIAVAMNRRLFVARARGRVAWCDFGAHI